MRIILAAAILLAAATFSRPLYAADDYKDCFKASTDAAQTEKGIAVCTRLVNTGKWKGLDLARLISNRAELYLKIQKLDLAMADLNRALAISPDYVFGYDNRGEVWRLRGNYDKAIAEYNQAIHVDSSFLSAYYDRGQAYEAMGNRANALADYQRVLDAPGTDRPVDAWAKGQARTAIERLDKDTGAKDAGDKDAGGKGTSKDK